jgi:hypothetical protein
MGMNFVVFVENLADRSQEDVNKELGMVELTDEYAMNWELLNIEGRSYSQWHFPPRFFINSVEPKKWEALRKYLVRVRKFFGNGKVMLTSDSCWPGFPDDEEDITEDCLPCALSEEKLQELNYEKHQKYRNIQELEGLAW